MNEFIYENNENISRQAFMMSTLTTLLHIWGKMLHLPILVPKFHGRIWHQNMQRGEEVHGAQGCIFWCHIFPPNFGTKIAKYSIFPQNWRSIVSVDNAKVCLDIFHYFNSVLLCWLLTSLINKIKNLHSIVYTYLCDAYVVHNGTIAFLRSRYLKTGETIFFVYVMLLALVSVTHGTDSTINSDTAFLMSRQWKWSTTWFLVIWCHWPGISVTWCQQYHQ